MDVERFFDGALYVFFFNWVTFELVDKNSGTGHKPRGAVTALKCEIIHKCLLHRAELLDLALSVEFGVALNSDDLATIKHMSAVNTGAAFFLSAVFLHLDNGASMTDPLTAPKTGPGEVEIMV